MKQTLLAFALIVVASGLAVANYGSVLETFCARQTGSVVVLNWQSGVERGVRNYAVERSVASSEEFRSITSVPAKGDLSVYQFRDTIAATQSQSAYKYRLRVVFDNGIEFSRAVVVRQPYRKLGNQDLVPATRSGLATR